MTADVELLPLPPLYIAPSVEPVDYPNVAQALMDYARANVAHATAAKDAEIKTLRAAVEAVWAAMPRDARYLDPPDGGCVPLHEQVRRMAADATRAERLAEALRELVEYVQETAHHNAPAAAAARAALRDHDQEVGNG